MINSLAQTGEKNAMQHGIHWNCRNRAKSKGSDWFNQILQPILCVPIILPSKNLPRFLTFCRLRRPQSTTGFVLFLLIEMCGGDGSAAG